MVLKLCYYVYLISILLYFRWRLVFLTMKQICTKYTTIKSVTCWNIAKFFLTKISFWPKILLDQKFFLDQKYFLDQKFFWTKKFFGDQKFFRDQNFFGDQKFFGNKNFSGPKIFGDQKFFEDQKFFGTKNKLYLKLEFDTEDQVLLKVTDIKWTHM